MMSLEEVQNRIFWKNPAEVTGRIFRYNFFFLKSNFPDFLKSLKKALKIWRQKSGKLDLKKKL